MKNSKKFQFDFSNQVVLVTGSAKGIGAGIARCFASSGAKMVIHFNSHQAEAELMQKAIHDNGGEAMIVQADLTDSAQVERMFDQIQQKFGSADVLINNAGIYPVSNIVDMSEKEWDAVITINMKGVFLCTRRFARDLIKAQKPGSIVNIDSIEALNSTLGHSHYVAAKAGVMMFSKTAALELGRHGIRVNSVGPGLINSPGLSASWPEGVSRWMKRVPLARLGEPEDIGDACLFLASEAARWIAGAHLIVDGGMLTNERY